MGHPLNLLLDKLVLVNNLKKENQEKLLISVSCGIATLCLILFPMPYKLWSYYLLFSSLYLVLIPNNIGHSLFLQFLIKLDVEENKSVDVNMLSTGCESIIFGLIFYALNRL